MHPTFPHERRGFPRGYVAAVATVFVGQERIGEYSVRDLSAGGASLVDGPPLAAGTTCNLLLRMPGLGSLRLSGEIAHMSDERSHWLGIRFTNLKPEVLDGLKELVFQELERAQVPSVLVADANLERLANTADALATLGERPVLARSSQDVAAWLADPDTTVAVALIAGGLRTAAGEDLLDYLREEFPRVQAFTIDDPLDEEELQRLLDQVPPVRPSKQPGCLRPSCTAH